MTLRAAVLRFRAGCAFATVFVATLTAAGPARAQPTHYTFIPTHTWAQFGVLHFGTSGPATASGRWRAA